MRNCCPEQTLAHGNYAESHIVCIGPCVSHGVESAPCVKNGQCIRHFPKKYCRETQLGQDSYALYRRRAPADGGETANIVRRTRNYVVTNANVVPYSPYLTAKYDAHINVEVCTTVSATKYLFKYGNAAILTCQSSTRHVSLPYILLLYPPQIYLQRSRSRPHTACS